MRWSGALGLMLCASSASCGVLFGLGGDDDESPALGDAGFGADVEPAHDDSGPVGPGDSGPSDGEDAANLEDASNTDDAPTFIDDASSDGGFDASGIPGRLAFVTNAKATGNIAAGATLAELEGECKKAADNAGLPAAWTYTPFLYFTASAPTARLSKGADWYRRDGVKVAGGDPKLLVALDAPISLTAAGAPVPAAERVWTGAPGSGGAGGAPNCTEWTTTAGKAVAGDLQSALSGLAAATTLSCAMKAHVYCFQK